MSETLLSIRDLVVHYGVIRALSGISLEVPRGKIVALIGANGAGKSTTLRAISGLLRPTSGAIEFQGRSIAGIPTLSSHLFTLRSQYFDPATYAEGPQPDALFALPSYCTPTCPGINICTLV